MKTGLDKGAKRVALISSILLVAVYLFPIWIIRLEAPQYPEGLKMEIMINKIAGQLDIINDLNHYIGMKIIATADIKELQIMPYILLFIIALGVWVWRKGGIKSFTAWAWLLIVSGIAGVADFYAWEYDYGHNLDPHAAIKIPGMTYQPPLWGSEKLLNFTAHSDPGIGGYVLIGVGLLVFIEWVRVILPHITHKPLPSMHIWAKIIVVFVWIFGASCSTNTVPLNYGVDNCAYCKMQLDNRHYGCELVTSKGKVYKFDSNECLAYFLLKHPDIASQAAKIVVVDYNKPGMLISANSSVFVGNGQLHSPMGMNIAAFPDTAEAHIAQKEYGGRVMSWCDMMHYVKNSMKVTASNE